jgi:hypothetical protein
MKSVRRLAAASSSKRRGPSKEKSKLLVQHALLAHRLLDSRLRGNDGLESLLRPFEGGAHSAPSEDTVR